MAHPLANRVAHKMNGLGNEIVVLDLRGTDLRGTDLRGADAFVDADAARAVGRMPGLGFDQLMVLGDARDSGHAGRLRIFNIDGSRAEACGNGTRCVAAYLARCGEGGDLELESDTGLLHVRREPDGGFTVDMGAPRLDWAEIPLRSAHDTNGVALDPPVAGAPATFSAVNMGNPHAVFFVSDAAAVDLGRVGPPVETHALFPARVNVGFAQILAPDRILLRVWERGAGATRACGSAACAALVAAARAGLTGRQATVTLPGGDLRIRWREADGHVLMTGPAEWEREVRLDPALLPHAESAA